MRLVPAENGLALTLGAVQPGDATFEHGEQTVLAMDPIVSDALAERVLDVGKSEEGPQFSLS